MNYKLELFGVCWSVIYFRESFFFKIEGFFDYYCGCNKFFWSCKMLFIFNYYEEIDNEYIVIFYRRVCLFCIVKYLNFEKY